MFSPTFEQFPAETFQKLDFRGLRYMDTSVVLYLLEIDPN